MDILIEGEAQQLQQLRETPMQWVVLVEGEGENITVQAETEAQAVKATVRELRKTGVADYELERHGDILAHAHGKWRPWHPNRRQGMHHRAGRRLQRTRECLRAEGRVITPTELGSDNARYVN